MKKHLVIAVCAPFLFVGAAWGLDITQCGQRVPAGETGVLQADLDCPPVLQFCRNDPAVTCSTDVDCPISQTNPGICIGAAVILEPAARLQLNAHDMKGGASATVYCLANCGVTGPGQLEQPGSAVIVHGKRNLVISDVETVGGFAGIFVEGRLRATNVTATNPESYGLYAFRVRAENVTVQGSGLWGILAWKSVAGRDITVNNSAYHGVGAARVRVTNLTATGNGAAGVASFSAGLKDSTLTGNGEADILTKYRPRLTNTTCGQSSQTGAPASNWSVCQND